MDSDKQISLSLQTDVLDKLLKKEYVQMMLNDSEIQAIKMGMACIDTIKITLNTLKSYENMGATNISTSSMIDNFNSNLQKTLQWRM